MEEYGWGVRDPLRDQLSLRPPTIREWARERVFLFEEDRSSETCSRGGKIGCFLIFL